MIRIEQLGYTVSTCNSSEKTLELFKAYCPIFHKFSVIKIVPNQNMRKT